MDNRERITRLARGESVDRKPLFFYFGPWGETIERWRREGAKIEDGPEGFQRAFRLDRGIAILPLNQGYAPAFEEAILEDRGDRVLFRDGRGITQLIRRDGASIPQFLDFPVRCREDWLRLKRERLDPDAPGRLPEDFDEWVKRAQAGHAALQLGQYPYGLFGTLRDMIGAETLLTWFYDEPELIHEMMDGLTDLWLELYGRVVRRVRVDVIHIWEDMSGKTGSLISPRMVREFMCPNYRRIRDFADRHDIPIVALDTDGNCTELIPPFMDAGINLIMPFEVQAGMDVCRVAKEYPDLCVMGGFDKRALWTGKEAIDREVERIRPMFDAGVKYFVAPDHLIPPEVSLENFTYFLDRVRPLL